MSVSIIVPAAVPTREDLRRIGSACAGMDAEVILVRDPQGGAPTGMDDADLATVLPVRLVEGAMTDALVASQSTYCVVLEGGPECRPELIPALVARLDDGDVDLVVVARTGGTPGPDGRSVGAPQRGVSRLARTLFPERLAGCTDPTSGFFALRRSALGAGVLPPRNSGLQLEILLRRPVRGRVGEVQLPTGRHAAVRPGALPEDLRALRRLAELRVGRAGLYAAVGGAGTVLNLLIMTALVAFGAHYVTAALAAAGLTILSNFALQEKLVFAEDTRSAQMLRHRFVQSVGFNTIEALLRMPFLLLLVEVLLLNSVVAQAGTLAAAFVVRYLFHAKVVYRRRSAGTLHPPLLNPAET